MRCALAEHQCGHVHGKRGKYSRTNQSKITGASVQDSVVFLTPVQASSLTKCPVSEVHATICGANFSLHGASAPLPRPEACPNICLPATLKLFHGFQSQELDAANPFRSIRHWSRARSLTSLFIPLLWSRCPAIANVAKP